MKEVAWADELCFCDSPVDRRYAKKEQEGEEEHLIACGRGAGDGVTACKDMQREWRVTERGV